MKITIIGSGLMGSALGTAWARHGHSVFFTYSRDFSKLEKLAQQVGHNARAALPAEALAQSDAALIAVHWQRVDDVLAQAGNLHNKILLSCMLPMTADDSQLALGFTTSGAEELAKRSHARVIATFNTVWSDLITAQADNKGAQPGMFYAGDDEEAQQIARQLIQDAGFEAHYVGGLSTARLLEPFGLLMGHLGMMYDPLVSYRFFKPL